jgi:hypothetical protein
MLKPKLFRQSPSDYAHVIARALDTHQPDRVLAVLLPIPEKVLKEFAIELVAGARTPSGAARMSGLK